MHAPEVHNQLVSYSGQVRLKCVGCRPCPDSAVALLPRVRGGGGGGGASTAGLAISAGACSLASLLRCPFFPIDILQSGMDPFSITATALSLAANILRAVIAVKDAVDEFQDAPAVARDIEHEIKVVQAALRQVEAVLQRDSHAIWRLELDEVFALSVEGCRDTLQGMDEELNGLFGRQDWKAALAVWWSAGEIRRLLARLERKKGSLVLLVQALSL